MKKEIHNNLAEAFVDSINNIVLEFEKEKQGLLASKIDRKGMEIISLLYQIPIDGHKISSPEPSIEIEITDEM